jgi:hypothetical protein
LLPLKGIHVIGSIAGKLRETSNILAHHHGSSLHFLEFLLLELDNTFKYVMRWESHLELIAVDAFEFFMSFYICIPPIRCRAHQLVSSQYYLHPVVALHNLKLLLYCLEPIIDVQGFDIV